jgi:hypothetical protein
MHKNSSLIVMSTTLFNCGWHPYTLTTACMWLAPPYLDNRLYLARDLFIV